MERHHQQEEERLPGLCHPRGGSAGLEGDYQGSLMCEWSGWLSASSEQCYSGMGEHSGLTQVTGPLSPRCSWLFSVLIWFKVKHCGIIVLYDYLYLILLESIWHFNRYVQVLLLLEAHHVSAEICVYSCHLATLYPRFAAH